MVRQLCSAPTFFLLPDIFCLPYIKSYDVRPLDTLKEKEIIHEKALENDYILFFCYDPIHECAKLKRDDRGRIVLGKTMTLAEALAE